MDSAAYARRQAAIRKPDTLPYGPFLTIKPVPGDTQNRPRNLIWGHMFDPDLHYLKQKYDYFGIDVRHNSSRIRCMECGIRLRDVDRCPVCQAAYNARQVPYVPLTVEQESRGRAIRQAQGRVCE